MYVFVPSKFELPQNAAADKATTALEEFTAATKAKRNHDIPFTDKSIINAIGVLSKLLQPTARATPSTASRQRMPNDDVQRPGWLITTSIMLYDLQGWIITMIMTYKVQGCFGQEQRFINRSIHAE